MIYREQITLSEFVKMKQKDGIDEKRIKAMIEIVKKSIAPVEFAYCIGKRWIPDAFLVVRNDK